MPRAASALRSRAAAVLRALRAVRPGASVELDHSGPLQLLIATILSAQCTDERVNKVTPALFRAWPDAAALARAPLPALEAAIRPTGFFRAKARALKACCQALVERHSGRVPAALEELIRLPGVGRKTANVVLGAGYGVASGIVVDTHMARVARRLGLTRQTDPVKIERDLTALVPRHEWIFFSIAAILHGRYVCQARRPRCGACPLRAPCPSRGLEAALLAGRKSGRTGGSKARGAAAPPGARRPGRPRPVPGRT